MVILVSRVFKINSKYMSPEVSTMNTWTYTCRKHLSPCGSTVVCNWKAPELRIQTKWFLCFVHTFAQFVPAGGVCWWRHGNTFHTGRPQLLREGCEQREEKRRDHSHAAGRWHRDSWVHRVTVYVKAEIWFVRVTLGVCEG